MHFWFMKAVRLSQLGHFFNSTFFVCAVPSLNGTSWDFPKALQLHWLYLRLQLLLDILLLLCDTLALFFSSSTYIFIRHEMYLVYQNPVYTAWQCAVSQQVYDLICIYGINHANPNPVKAMLLPSVQSERLPAVIATGMQDTNHGSCEDSLNYIIRMKNMRKLTWPIFETTEKRKK